jgi:DNA-binding transcriptional LysR family regulator
MIELFERQRKGVALTAAGKSFLIDARRILEDCDASIRKAQRISRGEIGELAVGYMSALTHEFFGQGTGNLAANRPGNRHRLRRDGFRNAGTSPP